MTTHSFSVTITVSNQTICDLLVIAEIVFLNVESKCFAI